MLRKGGKTVKLIKLSISSRQREFKTSIHDISIFPQPIGSDKASVLILSKPNTIASRRQRKPHTAKIACFLFWMQWSVKSNSRENKAVASESKAFVNIKM